MFDVVRFAIRDRTRQVFHLPELLTRRNLNELRREIDAAVLKWREPVLLVCDSRGGNGLGAIVFASYLRRLPVIVVTIVLKLVASAAAVIFAAGKVRVMKPDAVIGLHGASWEPDPKVIDEAELPLYCVPLKARVIQPDVLTGPAIASPVLKKVVVGEADLPLHSVTFPKNVRTMTSYMAMLRRFSGHALPGMFESEFVWLEASRVMKLGLADRTSRLPVVRGWAMAARL